MLRMNAVVWVSLLAASASPAPATEDAITMPLADATLLQPHNVTVKAVRYGGSDALEVRLNGAYRGPDMDTFAFVPGLDFHDGTIEVGRRRVSAFQTRRRALRASSGSLSASMWKAPPLHARVSTSARPTAAPRTRFAETIRPSISLIPAMISTDCGAKHPAATKYADLVPGAWTHLRIEVSGATARLYVGAAARPVLIVQDLKRGADAHGPRAVEDSGPRSLPQPVRPHGEADGPAMTQAQSL